MDTLYIWLCRDFFRNILDCLLSLKDQTDFFILKCRVCLEEKDTKRAMEFARKAIEIDHNPETIFCKEYFFFKDYLFRSNSLLY